MQKKTTKPQTKPSVDWEAVRVLAIELGAREAARRLGIKESTVLSRAEAARRLGIKESTVLSRAKRDKWNLPKRKGGATLKNATAITLQSKPGDALIASHKELEGATKTGLMLTAAKAAAHAAQKPPLDVSNTSQFRDLTNSSSRIFGWNSKIAPQMYNQVVITQEQLREIGMLRESVDQEETSENVKERIERLSTPEGQEELRRTASEWLGREENMEQSKRPPTPSAPEIYEVTIRGDGGGVKVRR